MSTERIRECIKGLELNSAQANALASHLARVDRLERNYNMLLSRIGFWASKAEDDCIKMKALIAGLRKGEQ